MHGRVSGHGSWGFGLFSVFRARETLGLEGRNGTGIDSHFARASSIIIAHVNTVLN